ncbi:MAG: carotenoid biosynthesis protein [Acidimicrobiales bacterium]
MHEIYGTFVVRWYVTVLGAVYLWRAVVHMGWRKTLLYTALALGVGLLAENGSVHFGFPYTGYTFNPALRSKEIFVGSVPLMVPMSYTFMGYLGFAAGRLLASGPWRTRGSSLWQEYLLAMVLTVWALWILDPVSRLGQRWFLGRLFHYDGPGFWFGLPLGSQLGFVLTAAILLGILALMTRHDPQQPVATWTQHPNMTAFITYQMQVGWMAVVAMVLGANEIGGAWLLIWIPMSAVTAVMWSNMRKPSEAATSERDTAFNEALAR